MNQKYLAVLMTLILVFSQLANPIHTFSQSEVGYMLEVEADKNVTLGDPIRVQFTTRIADSLVKGNVACKIVNQSGSAILYVSEIRTDENGVVVTSIGTEKFTQGTYELTALFGDVKVIENIHLKKKSNSGSTDKPTKKRQKKTKTIEKVIRQQTKI